MCLTPPSLPLQHCIFYVTPVEKQNIVILDHIFFMLELETTLNSSTACSLHSLPSVISARRCDVPVPEAQSLRGQPKSTVQIHLVLQLRTHGV